MPRRVAACAILLLLASAAARPQQARSDELPPDTLIVLERGACEHRCPVYRIVVFADGSALFDGRYFVRRAETIRTKVSLETLGKLIAAIQAAGFFEGKQRYAPGEDGCPTPKSDAATVILSVSTAGKSKTVVHYHGCAGPEPERLARLEDQIDAAVNSARWVR